MDLVGHISHDVACRACQMYLESDWLLALLEEAILDSRLTIYHIYYILYIIHYILYIQHVTTRSKAFKSPMVGCFLKSACQVERVKHRQCFGVATLEAHSCSVTFSMFCLIYRLFGTYDGNTPRPRPQPHTVAQKE